MFLLPNSVDRGTEEERAPPPPATHTHTVLRPAIVGKLSARHRRTVDELDERARARGQRATRARRPPTSRQTCLFGSETKTTILERLGGGESHFHFLVCERIPFDIVGNGL